MKCKKNDVNRRLRCTPVQVPGRKTFSWLTINKIEPKDVRIDGSNRNVDSRGCFSSRRLCGICGLRR